MKMTSVKPDLGTAISSTTLPDDLQRIHQLVHEPLKFADLPHRRHAFRPTRQAASAKRADEAAHAQQIAALELLNDGAAFSQYRAALSLDDKLNILGGKECGADARAYRPAAATARYNEAKLGEVLEHVARLSQRVLSSWLGAPSDPQKQATPAYVRAR